MTLLSLGWNDTFAHHFDQLGHDTLIPARVVRQDVQRYLVRAETGLYTALLLGRMQYESDEAQRPTVGDWVGIEIFDDDQAILHMVLPRFSTFARKVAGSTTRRQVIAANIDTAFLVSGLDHDFNVRRIERYVVQTANSGAEPVIVLNKADVCDAIEARVREVERVVPDVEVIALSAQTGTGLDALQAHLKTGRTVAFLGSSGVGKSTLVNRLLGDQRQATQAVRSDDSRGRHTTTHREVFILPDGGVLIDTPGLRELQLWAEPSDLHAAFTDIETLATKCRFKDCSHEVEPGCAVQAALADGELEADRFESYLKLKRELLYLDRRKDEAVRLQRKKREKHFGKLVKSINRHNPKRR